MGVDVSRPRKIYEETAELKGQMDLRFGFEEGREEFGCQSGRSNGIGVFRRSGDFHVLCCCIGEICAGEADAAQQLLLPS